VVAKAKTPAKTIKETAPKHAFTAPAQPKSEATQKAYLILKYAHDTAESMLEAFSTVRKARNAKQGATTDEEQDLLRAMVVFAGAGIDALTKQLIRDALPVMVEKLPEARERIEKHVAKHLRKGGETIVDEEGASQGIVNPQRMAKILMADNPRAGLLELIVGDLTAGSLQSVQELHRVVGYLGLESKNLGVTEQELRDVFACRNRLIHEMDVNFQHPTRSRSSRNRADMTRFANSLLTASSMILDGVDAQLRGV
jgi:hypothetical protein